MVTKEIGRLPAHLVKTGSPPYAECSVWCGRGRSRQGRTRGSVCAHAAAWLFFVLLRMYSGVDCNVLGKYSAGTGLMDIWEAPRAIDSIFSKPGHARSEEDLRVIVDWIEESCQCETKAGDEPRRVCPRREDLIRAGRRVLWSLGRGQDAEDYWQKFCLAKRLERVVRSYDPSRLRFQTYVKLVFQRFCVKEAVRTRSVIKHRQFPVISLEHGKVREFEFPDPHQFDPVKAEKVAALLDCLARLPQPSRSAIETYYFANAPVREVARLLGVKQNYAKLILHRGRMSLKGCLSRKGIGP
jgi:RNA polymerase sigma factor (sigma-70 family)